jgi:hypothetical protein
LNALYEIGFDLPDWGWSGEEQKDAREEAVSVGFGKQKGNAVALLAHLASKTKRELC